MNNAANVDHVAETHDFTKSYARKVVDAVFVAMIDAAADGNEVLITGFGRLKVKDKLNG